MAPYLDHAGNSAGSRGGSRSSGWAAPAAAAAAAPTALLLVFSSCFSTVASVAAAPLEAQAEDLVYKRGIAYGFATNPLTRKNETLWSDVLYANTSGGSPARRKRPAAVCVHGGGFTGGSRKAMCCRVLSKWLALRGFVVLNIDYRLTRDPRDIDRRCATGTAWNRYMYLPAKDIAHDIKAAVRFLRSSAATWDVDPDRVAVLGDSAGAIGSLVMAYTSPGEGFSGTPAQRSDVGAVVAISGTMSDPREECTRQAHCCPGTCITDRTKDINGQAYPPQPPLCVVHDEEDPTVPTPNGVRLHLRARATGLMSKLILMEGKGHSRCGRLLEEPYVHSLWEFLRSALDLEPQALPAGGSDHSGFGAER